MNRKAFTLIIFFFTLIQCIYSQAIEIDLDQKLTLNKEIIYRITLYLDTCIESSGVALSKEFNIRE